MTFTGLFTFILVSFFVWLLGLALKGVSHEQTYTDFEPKPPAWWERDIEAFIRHYWPWIVAFLIWLAVAYIALIYALALGAASISHLPKPLP